MSRGSAERGMQHAYIYHAWHGLELRQKAIGRVWVSEANATYGDPFREDIVPTAPIKDMDVFGPRNLAGDRAFSIVVAANDEDADVPYHSSRRTVSGFNPP